MFSLSFFVPSLTLKWLFFSFMTCEFEYKAGPPFTKKFKHCFTLIWRKNELPNNTFWMRNKSQITSSLCALHLLVYLSLCSCSNSYSVDHRLECQSGRYSRKIGSVAFKFFILFCSYFCFKTRRKYSNDMELTEKSRCLQFIFLDWILIEFA